MVEFKNSGIRSNALDGIFRKTELSRQKCLDIGVFCQGMSPDDSITAPSEKGLLHRWSRSRSGRFIRNDHRQGSRDRQYFHIFVLNRNLFSNCTIFVESV